MRIERLSQVPLDRALRKARSQSPTYTEVGATLAGNDDLPAGYRHDRYEVTLGSGSETFEKATEGLRSWQAHRQPGISVYPADTTIEATATVLVCMGRGLGLIAPCRIVGLTEDSSHWSFAYGTLPGHPERGEEAFTVGMGPDGMVCFRITAFSRPASLLTKVSRPIGRSIQQKATDGYLGALRRYVLGTVT